MLMFMSFTIATQSMIPHIGRLNSLIAELDIPTSAGVDLIFHGFFDKFDKN